MKSLDNVKPLECGDIAWFDRDDGILHDVYEPVDDKCIASIKGNGIKYFRYANSPYNGTEVKSSIDVTPYTSLSIERSFLSGKKSALIFADNALEAMVAIFSGAEKVKCYSRNSLTAHLIALHMAAALTLSKKEYALHMIPIKSGSKTSFLQGLNYSKELDEALTAISPASQDFWKNMLCDLKNRNDIRSLRDNLFTSSGIKGEDVNNMIPYLNSQLGYDKLGNMIKNGVSVEYVSSGLPREAYLGREHADGLVFVIDQNWANAIMPQGEVTQRQINSALKAQSVVVNGMLRLADECLIVDPKNDNNTRIASLALRR